MNSERPAPDPDYVLRGHTDSVSSVACSNDMYNGFKSLLTGSVSGDAKLWDLRIRRSVQDFKCSESILLVGFLDQNNLISHARDGIVQVFDVRSPNKSLDDFSVGAGTFCPISYWQKDGDWLITAPSGSGSEVHVLELKNKKTLAEFKPEEKLGMVMRLKIFKHNISGKIYVLGGYEDGSLRLWSVEEGSEVASSRIQEEPIMCLDVDEINMKAVAGSATTKLSLVELAQDHNKGIKEVVSQELRTSGLGALAIRGDTKLVAAGSWNGRIHLFGCKRLKPLAVLKYHKETINSLCFSPTFHFAAGSKDSRISIWSVYRQ